MSAVDLWQLIDSGVPSLNGPGAGPKADEAVRPRPAPSDCCAGKGAPPRDPKADEAVRPGAPVISARAVARPCQVRRYQPPPSTQSSAEAPSSEGSQPHSAAQQPRDGKPDGPAAPAPAAGAVAVPPLSSSSTALE